MLTPQIIIKRIKTEYPKGVDLIYVDYRENLNDEHEKLEELATTGFVNEMIDFNTLADNQYETIKELAKQLFSEEELIEIRNNDELTEALHTTFLEMDTSTPEKDLLKNTNRQYFYYDLNFTVEEAIDQASIETEAKRIARFLRLGYSKHKAILHELVSNAGYSGQLVILFTTEPLALEGEQQGYITFDRNYTLCIMNRDNGSGYDVDLKIPLAFQFIRANLHNDRGHAGYSYSYDVCGLVMADEAVFNITANKTKAKYKLIAIQENEVDKDFTERERKYQATFDAGKCTLGDMRYNRHRNMEYRNDYPCGHKCQDCGTFFID